MKRFLAFAMAVLLLLGMAPVAKANAAEEKERKLTAFLYWVVTPVDYYGNVHVYLHSDANPDGTLIRNLEPFYQNENWNVYAILDDNLLKREGTYWATISTDTEDLFPGYISAIYPDLEPKSVIPNINTSITSRYYEFSLLSDPNITKNNPNGRYIKDTDFANGFFGYIVPAEMVAETEKNLNELFINLMKEYLQKVSANYSMTTAKSELYHKLVPAGHFDDYITLFQPLGVTCSEYADWTRNWLLWDLIPGNSNAQNSGLLFSTYHQKKQEADYLYSNDAAVLLKNMFGWEIYYDSSDVILSDNGGVATEFVFPDSENLGENTAIVKIPALDGSIIPKGTIFPVIGDFTKYTGIEPETIKDIIPTDVIGNYANATGTIPTTTPNNPDNPNAPTTTPSGSGSESGDNVEIVEKIPTKTPDNNPTKAPAANTPTEPVTGEDSNNLLPIILVLICIIGAGGIGFIILKRKK